MTAKLVIPETAQFTQLGGDPAAVSGKALVYSKPVGGIAQLFVQAGDGVVAQVGTGSGAFSPPERWAQVNIAASQTNVALSAQVSGNANTIKMAAPGSIVGLITQLTEAITAGTLTVTVTKNGSPVTLSAVHTSGLGTQIRQAVGIDTYVAGDVLGVQLTTDAGFLPITTDIEAWIQCSETVAGTPGMPILPAIGGIVTGATDGSVFYANGTSLAQDNSNLYYDATSKRLGLGTNGPSTILDIAGAGNTAALALRAGASAALSVAGTARLRFNQSTNKLQVSENGGAYADIATGVGFTLDIADAIGSSTVGSVLFVGAGSDLQQDNANFFWDNTNNRLAIGHNSPQVPIHVVNSAISITSIGRLQSLNPSGNSSFDFYDDGGINRFGIGYDNLPDRAQLSMNNSTPFVIVDNSIGQTVKFFNNGNVNIGPTTTDPGARLRVEGATQLTANSSNDTLYIRNQGVTGYSAAFYQDHLGTGKFAIGWGNTSAGDANVAGRSYFNIFDSNFIWTKTTGSPVLAYVQNSTGNFGIGNNTSPGALLHVFGTTMVNALGTTLPTFSGGSSASLVVSQGGGNWGIVCARATNDAVAPHLTLFKTRATDPSVKTALLSGDFLGDVTFQGVDTSGAALSGAAIGAVVSASPGAGTLPTDLYFATTTGSTPTERMRITAAGQLQVSYLTTGSVLFTGASGAVLQDNANFFWDDTNNRLGIGTSGPDSPLRITSAATHAIRVQCTLDVGHASLSMYDHLNVSQAAFGWGNTAGSDTSRAGKSYWGTNGNDFVVIRAFGTPSTVTATFTGDGAFQVHDSSAAVSASSTGRLRYTTTGQVLQTSLNGGSYFNLPQLEAALTTGSILFANASGRLAQDNANLFWDDTNNRLGLGTVAPDTRLHVAIDAAPVALIERLTSGTSTWLNTLWVQASSSGDILDGFGPNVLFRAKDTGGTFSLGHISMVRAGADSTGDFVVYPNTAGTPNERLRVVSDGGLQMPDSASAVSASGTGRLRYTTTGQKFQVSLNGAAYVDVATYQTALSNMNVLYANSANQIDQDANFTWDDSNHTLTTYSPTGSSSISCVNSGTEAPRQLRNNSTAGIVGIRFVNDVGNDKLRLGWMGAFGSGVRANRSFIWRESGVDFLIGRATTGTADLMVTSAGAVIIGGPTALTKTGFTHEFSADAAQSIVASSYGTGLNAEYNVFRGRGTGTTTTAVQSGDVLGAFSFSGAQDATTVYTGSFIQAKAAENWSTTVSGSSLEFFTTLIGGIGSGRLVRLRIEDDGGLTLANSAAAAVSGSNELRLRYNTTGHVLQISKNTAAYETVASLATAQTFTKSQNVAAVALTDAANIATDASLGNVFTVTLTDNRTLDNPTNLVSGGVYRWIVTQDATGSRTLAYGTMFKWPGGTAPTLTTAANAVDTIEAVYNGTVLLATFALNYS